MRQNRNLVSAARAGCHRAVCEQLFAGMQTSLPNRPKDLVAEPVREVDLLCLLDLDEVRTTIVEGRVMGRYDRIVGRGLL
jgi:hypothetical protein